MKRYKERRCPGCGGMDERPPQKLCQDCFRQLALGRKREKEIALLESSGETGFRAGRDIIRRLGTAGLAELNALAIK